jgi:hypothetical protein
MEKNKAGYIISVSVLLGVVGLGERMFGEWWWEFVSGT